jgi:predicted amidohydrolase YtcJ
MAKALGSRILAVALALVFSACADKRIVYHGGTILTMDGDHSVAEAFGIDGDEIAVVGKTADVLAWAESRARTIDLAGRVVLPGFIDAHGHFPGEGLYARYADLQSPPVGTVGNLAEIVTRLRRQQRRNTEWIIGIGYDDTLLPEARHPSRADLDAVSTTRPVAALHVSAHLAAVNSRALELLGIDALTPDPAGGRIVRNVEGDPPGVLEETAMEPVLERVFALGTIDAVRVSRAAAKLALSRGVTTVQIGYGEERSLALAWLSRLGLLPVRVVYWPGDVLAEAVRSGRRTLPRIDPDWFRIGAVKLVADGSLQGYTGFLTRPYHVSQDDDPSFRGYPRIERDELIRKVGVFHAAGWQVAVHGNGDAAIDDILDAFESAQRSHPRADSRPIIVHAQTMRPDQLARARTLGVIPSFFALHTYYWGDRHRDVFLGPERAARISPAATAAREGVSFTLHCDAPVVPMEPLRLVWAAVNRRTSSGAELGGAERISPDAALRAITIDAAYQHFEEDRKGSIEPGKLADLVVLDRSPLDDPSGIDGIRVLETIVGGKTVYLADSRESTE